MTDKYRIIKKESLTDISSEGTYLEHIATGAKVLVIANNDENKVFDIAFRTPPADSTGVAHIIEHTVLCGSKKYPVKDPFVELAKGSLNTFLNAMTFPDKTMYPVASCNDADFKNLMEVYLDAVFYPNIYRDERIFKQEGWHYHLENKEDELTVNGVVYNEMKGAFSSPDEMLERNVFNSLFPDTPYGVESGGDPEVIPQLKYEDFLKFHADFYHPSNSYIYLYGNMDAERLLTFIDEEYLSHFEKKMIDSKIPAQKPFDAPKLQSLPYPILDDESEEDNTYLDASYVIADGAEIVKNTAFNVLEYVLLDAPGAPLKQAVLDAGIGKDVYGVYNDGILQPFFSIGAKYANKEDLEGFQKVIRQTLEKIVKEGIDHKALEAAINYFEFRFREADYASYPKGLIYAMAVFESWLYDDDAPFDYLKLLPVFEKLKQEIGTGYFENLIQKDLLDNTFCLLSVLYPEKGLAAKKESSEKEALRIYKESLSAEELNELESQTRDLQLYQETPDSPEDMACIPMLQRSDLSFDLNFEIKNTVLKEEETEILLHEYDTNGIVYLKLLFELPDMDAETAGYLSLLKSVFGNIGTKNFSYNALSNEINARTGGIVFGLEAFPQLTGKDRRFFGIHAKYLKNDTGFVFEMIKEILFTSDFSDTKRIYEILSNQRSALKEYLTSAGHVSASNRAAAGLLENAAWEESISGISYYRFIEDLYKNYETKNKEIAKKFGDLAQAVLRPEKICVSITADAAAAEELRPELSALKTELYTGPVCQTGHFNWEKHGAKEAFKTSGQVQYVALCGNFVDAGYEYTGAMRILKTILNYEYLWTNLRVKGGAYGCMSIFRRTGISHLVSYRDPHLKNTLDVYAGLPAFLEQFTADEHEMTKFILGTMSELDAPMTARIKGKSAFAMYMSGITKEMLLQERRQILTAEDADIRDLAKLLQKTFDFEHICVIGCESAIEKHRELFDSVENLVQI